MGVYLVRLKYNPSFTLKRPCEPNIYIDSFLWPLLLTWFNFNPSMDK